MDAAHDILLAQIDRLARDAAVDMLRVNQDGLIDDLLASKNAAIEGLRERLASAKAALDQALVQNATYADLRQRIANLEERAVSAEKELAFLRDHVLQDWQVRHRWINGRLTALTEMLAATVLDAPQPLATGVTMVGLIRQDQSIPGLSVEGERPVSASSFREMADNGPHALELAIPTLVADRGISLKLALLPTNRRFLALGWRKQASASTSLIAVLDLFEGGLVRSTSALPAWLRVTAAGAGWTSVEAMLPADLREGCLVLSTAVSGIGADRFPGDGGCGFALQGPFWTEGPVRN